MSETVLRVENLSKSYVLGGASGSFGWLKQRLQGPDPGQILWALDDVSFEVKRGEALGIVGANGAGKSTLLRILSRITEPTAGFAEYRGRMASLLEVGTGMHAELTGRENIYMNAVLLGMTRHEVGARFDEIVAFSGLERFIDTPVKRYSSGMGVRLGFAIAAHLDPEILLVDEVLAVGDAEFQRKCLGKMEDVTTHGRTVLFVSHNMHAVEGLCTRAIQLAGGRKAAEGSSHQVIRQYLDETAGTGSVDLSHPGASRQGEGAIKATQVTASLLDGSISTVFPLHDPIRIRLSLEGPSGAIFQLGIGIRDLLGNQIIHQDTLGLERSLALDSNGQAQVELEFENTLNAGDYYVTYWVGDKWEVTQDYCRDCLKIVSDTTKNGRSQMKGFVVSRCRWRVL